MALSAAIYYGQARSSSAINGKLSGFDYGPREGFDVVPGAGLTVSILNALEPTKGNAFLHRSGALLTETANEVASVELVADPGLTKAWYLCVRYAHGSEVTTGSVVALEVGDITANDSPFAVVNLAAGAVAIAPTDIEVMPKSCVIYKYGAGAAIDHVRGRTFPISQVYGEECVESHQVIDFAGADNGFLMPDDPPWPPGSTRNWSTWEPDVDTEVDYSLYLPKTFATAKAQLTPALCYFRLWLRNVGAGSGAGNIILAHQWRGAPEAGGAVVVDTRTDTVSISTVTADNVTVITFALHPDQVALGAGAMIRGQISRLGTNLSDTYDGVVQVLGGAFYFPADKVGAWYQQSLPSLPE